MKIPFFAALGRNSPLLALCLVLSVYFLLYFNRYAPITEGWFIAFAKLLQNGQKPYQDFSLLLPPLYTLQTAGFQALFGYDLFNFRLAGLPVTVGIGVTLYKIFDVYFARWVSSFAATISTIYYQSGVAFIGYDFTQFLTLYLLIAFLFVLRFWSIQKLNSWQPHWYLYLAGIFLSLAILTKHSNGGLSAFFTIAVTAATVLRFNPFSLAIKRCGYMAAGVLTPLILVGGWLAYEGVLRDFFTNIGADALEAKGGFRVVLGAWIKFLVQSDHMNDSIAVFKDAFLLLGIIVGLTATSMLVRAHIFRQKLAIFDPESYAGIGQDSISRSSSVVLLFGMVTVVVATLVLRFGNRDWLHWLDGPGRSLSTYIVPGALDLYAIGGAIALAQSLGRGRATAVNWLLLFGFGAGLIFANGSSSQTLSEISTFLGLGIAISIALTLGITESVALLPSIALCVSLSSFYIAAKFDAPYAWWGISTASVSKTICGTEIPLLNGLCLDPGEQTKLNSIVEAIQQRTGPGDQIYVFPHMPIFNLLSGRPPFANAVVSWYDFMSDRQADKVADHLISEPPKIIVFANLPGSVAEMHERLFRTKKGLGQKHILEAIEQLLDRNIIQTVLKVENLNNVDILVYARQF
jgi:hypothetical protein